MKQIYLVMRNDCERHIVLACSSLDGAEALAKHMHKSDKLFSYDVNRVPFVIDIDKLFIDTDKLFDDYGYSGETE